MKKTDTKRRSVLRHKFIQQESDPVQYFLLGFIVKGTRQQDEIVSATTLMAAPPLSKPRQLGCCPKRQDLYPKKYAIYYGLHGYCLTFRATAGFGIGPTWSDRSWLFYAPATTRSIIRIIFHVWTNQTISWQSFFLHRPVVVEWWAPFWSIIDAISHLCRPQKANQNQLHKKADLFIRPIKKRNVNNKFKGFIHDSSSGS